MSIQDQMFKEQSEKKIFEQAREYAYEYLEGINEMDVFPSEENLQKLNAFDEALSNEQSSASSIIKLLHEIGTLGTIAQTGGRYFGFVNGGAVPVSIATKWLSDFWDQCGGLYLSSPINAKLEAVCEKWLKDIFGLPEETVAGFVSGTSLANVSALAAARYRLLLNQGWDINQKGLMGAPPLKIIAHKQSHTSVMKALTLIGFGRENVLWMDADEQGRMLTDQLPEIDNSTLILLQVGNVNTGAFDPFTEICEKANEVGAWVHVDGAFGLWAAATKSMSYLTEGMNKASSWAVDGHKTLNTPYDCGIVMCRDSEALITALQTTASYIIYSDKRDPILYTPEMSKRSRAIELWATMKYLGKDGIDEMITSFNHRAKQLAEGLKESGFELLNEVVYNQVLVRCENEELTKSTLKSIQESGECWCGGSIWEGQTAIRVSVCSWATTEADIERTINVFARSMNAHLIP